jgi:hypothetical protein
MVRGEDREGRVKYELITDEGFGFIIETRTFREPRPS